MRDLNAGRWLIIIVVAIGVDGLGDETAERPGLQTDEAVAFSVLPRVEQLYFFPCADCHEYMDPNEQIRELEEVDDEHPAKLEHGSGKIWCTSCHGVHPYNHLSTLLKEPLEFDQGYLVCGGCHSNKLRDWQHGSHGKRVGVWQGERKLYGCMECHNPHKPAIAARAPQPPPPVRAGLQRVEGHSKVVLPAWMRHEEEPAHD